MAERYVSLGEFERLHRVNKGTVSKRARELGYDTASGLSPAAYEAMKLEFHVSPVDDPPVSPTQRLRAGGLIPVGDQTITRNLGMFDADAYDADKQQLEVNARNQASSLNDMVAAYAQSRIASVLADIDLVADSLRANALQAMGTQPGKKPADGSSNGAA
jgi:hypothetical protein